MRFCCYLFILLLLNINYEALFALSIEELNKLKTCDEAYAVGEELLSKRQYADAANAYWKGGKSIFIHLSNICIT